LQQLEEEGDPLFASRRQLQFPSRRPTEGAADTLRTISREVALDHQNHRAIPDEYKEGHHAPHFFSSRPQAAVAAVIPITTRLLLNQNNKVVTIQIMLKVVQ